jgi:glycosyltransferase involved in cell wall biosynthesis
MLDITVIIPFYNNPDNLNRALLSISNQTIHPSTVIVIDDCSEHYEAISLLHQKVYPFDLTILHNQVNSGPSVARNLGMDNSRTKYIAFLDEDDEWHPSKLEIQFSLMERLDLLITSTNHSIEGLSSNRIEILKIKIRKLSFWSLLISNRVNTSTVMVRSDLYPLFRFNPILRYTQDYDLWLRISRTKNITLICAPLTLRKDGLYHGGLSSNLKKMFQDEIRTIDLNISSRPLKLIVLTWFSLKYFKRVLLFNLINRSNQK